MTDPSRFQRRTPVYGLHRRRMLYNYGRRIPVDEMIAPLISTLWDLNINTGGCCQGSCQGCCDRHHGIMRKRHMTRDGYRMFKVRKRLRVCDESVSLSFDVAGAREFKRLVLAGEDVESLRYVRINGFRINGRRPRGRWIWNCDGVLESDHETVVCIFPQTDLEFVMDKVIRGCVHDQSG